MRFILITLLSIYGTAWGQDGLFAPKAEGVLLQNPSYIVDFDISSKIANWVSYELTSTETKGSLKRTDNFSKDNRVSHSASSSSYRGSGYDRGHLKPAADSKSSLQEMSNSFLMTNMIPQTPSLNRGIWKSLEADVRNWANRYRVVHVTTGPSIQTITTLPSGVRVPYYSWKAVLRTYPDTSAVSFFIPNKNKIEGELSDYQISIDSLEKLIQIDLFPGLPDDVESRMEAEVSSSWTFSDKATFNSTKSGTQCLGIAKSTGKRCRNYTSHPSGKCHYHRD